MFTKEFWLAAFERATKSAAQAVILAWGVLDVALNAFKIEWSDTLGVALGGFILSLLTSLTFGAASGNPSAGNVEVVRPQP